MRPLRIALLPGDGIGPEVMQAARRILEATGLPLDFDEIPCGGQMYLQRGQEWPEDGAQRCAEAEVLLLGAVGWPDPRGRGPVCRGDGEMAGFEAVIGNRRRLDLYANVRPVRVLPGVRQRLAGRHLDAFDASVDLVIVRENTEGLYIGAGAVHRPGGRAEAAVDTRLITRRGAERVIRQAFALARRRAAARGAGDGRDDHAGGDLLGAPPRVTAVAKHNLLDGCRLFVEIFEAIAGEHPGVEAEAVIVDAFAQSILTEPSRYDVVVTTNLFGDVLTDLAAVLQGGMGMAVGANLGERHAMFEPIHGSAPDLAGRDRANPMAALLAAAEALRWLGERRDDPIARERLGAEADRIEGAVRAVVAAGTPLTADLVGPERARPASEVVEAVRRAMDAG